MKINTITSQKISKAKNLRISYSYAKECSAQFLSAYNDNCTIRLKDICNIEKGSSITSDDINEGTIPVVAGGKTYAYYHDAANRPGNIITVSASGANAGFVNYWNEPIWASDCTTIKSKDESAYPTKFVYYLLSLIQEDIFLLQKGAAQPHVYPDDLQYIMLPDIDVPKQIEILDSINVVENKINELLSNEISVQRIIDEDFQKRFEFDYGKFDKLRTARIYKTDILSFSGNPDLRFSAKFHRPAGQFVMSELQRITNHKIKHYICEPIVLGASISPNDFDKNGTAYYVSMATIKTLNVELDDTQLVSDSYFESKRDKSIKPNDIIIARSGAAIGKSAIVKESFDGVFADFTMRLHFDESKCNPYFAYYYIRSKYFQYLIEIYKKGLQNQNIFPIVIQEFPFPDITLSEQNSIVDVIQTKIKKQNDIKEEIAELRNNINCIIASEITN